MLYLADSIEFQYRKLLELIEDGKTVALLEAFAGWLQDAHRFVAKSEPYAPLPEVVRNTGVELSGAEADFLTYVEESLRRPGLYAEAAEGLDVPAVANIVNKCYDRFTTIRNS